MTVEVPDLVGLAEGCGVNGAAHKRSTRLDKRNRSLWARRTFLIT
jgi:hypothetical protein